jgi:metal-responsive CopG/Arc/MetJ family transcriptional regulator
MFQEVHFEDGRGEYSDVIRARAPRGLREKVKEVAEQEGVSAAELIRRAVSSYLNSNNNGRSALPSFGAGA